MEHCSSCGRDFKVSVQGAESMPVWELCCPYCEYRTEVENIPKIVWVLDEYSQTWYTKLVHKYTQPDGVKVLAFDYYK